MLEDIGEYFKQLRVLIWKNALLKWRYVGVLILEIAIPVIIIAAMIGVQKVIKPAYVDVSTPASYYYGATLESMIYPSCLGDNLFWSCNDLCGGSGSFNSFSDQNHAIKSKCRRRYIAIAPQSSGNADAVAAVSYFMNVASIAFTNFTAFQSFDSENDFINAIESSDYVYNSNKPIYSCGVIFNGVFPQWDYTLRMNKTFIIYNQNWNNPFTASSTPNTDISVHSNSDAGSKMKLPYSEQYLYTGIFSLMDYVNSFIASEACQAVTGNPNCFVNMRMEGVAPFPNQKATVNGFWSSVGAVFAILVIISVLYPFANVIRSLVQEKESKMREGMSMMAMRSSALWSSWMFHFIALYLPLAIILTLESKSLFTYSSQIYIFFYYFVFFLSSISYCIFISTLFSKARTAAIVGVMFFFAGYFIFIGLQFSVSSRSTILAAMLHPAAAFTFGTLAFIEYEDANIGVTKDTWNVSNIYPVTFQDSLTMMFVDFIYLGILAWYLNQIWPTEFGTQKPFYFIVSPHYWYTGTMDCLFSLGLIRKNGRGGYSNTNIQEQVHDDEFNPNVEPVTENFNSQIENNQCIDIRKLYKVFNTNTGKKVAVDQMSLTMFSGQITALLGHNGAGKSTLISMLTGLIPADDGDAIVEGLSIVENMSEIRRNLGVCPQHDILFPDLTVEEHLIMFASFKGTPKSQLYEEVDKMINSVGLTEKRKAFSKQLSGGQKRKLSVGIAFIGGSRIIYLDEPTSGMDPYSRRFTWNIIRQHREGRIICLTTHFMDEADILGDRIAIMGDGKLRCCGSSLFLKKLYGVGYNMVIEKKDTVKFDTSSITKVICGKVPEAKMITDAGAELSMEMPISSSSKFQELFEYFDNNLESLGIRSYGMSVTTLEEVFIKVAERTNTQMNAETGRKKAKEFKDEFNYVELQKQGSEEVPTKSSYALKKVSPDLFELDHEYNWWKFFIRHFYAMMLKRFFYFIRDTKSWILQYGVPVAFLLVGMLIMKFTTYNTIQPNKPLTPHMYNSAISSNYFPLPYSNGKRFCVPKRLDDPLSRFEFDDNIDTDYHQCNITNYQQEVMQHVSSDASNFPLLASGAESIFNMSQFINLHKKDYAATIEGAVSFLEIANNSAGTGTSTSTYKYVVHSNYSAVHGAPLVASLVASSILRFIDPITSLQVNLYPLPSTVQESTIADNFNVNLIVTFLLLAIPYIPASWVTYVVREREVKAKHQQLVSGVSGIAYWLSNWLWDNLSYQPTIWMFVILIAGFPNTQLLSSNSTGAMGITFGLLILFGSAMTGFSYLMSFCFGSPAGAQVATIFIVFCLGFLLTIVGTVLRFIPSTNAVYFQIRYFFCLFPPYALGDALNNMTLIQILSLSELQGGQQYNVHDWKISQMNLMMLAWESFAYLALTIIYEYIHIMPMFQQTISNIPITDNSLKDVDVIEQEKVIEDGQVTDSTIYVQDVKKVYPGGKFAVRGVSIGIPRGECFGLLGINGAGKSTLLSMLSGEITPTTGSIYLDGINVLTDIHQCRRKIGFCPQFDALFELLTAREHLQLYARIKGIKEDQINQVVDEKISELGLTEYADRAAGGYSGGNKRKLSVAIAMIGEPSIVFLDEPSTGMDPVARRFMWEVITDIVVKRDTCSAILTTHSMEEADALCNRVGIMVGGVLRCIGSSQRLRSRYGHGFQIEIGFQIPTIEEIDTTMKEILSNIEIFVNNVNNDNDYPLTKKEFDQVLIASNKSHWNERISLIGSGADIFAHLESSKSISAKYLANWWILENCYDNLSTFLVEHFKVFYLRERQVSKVRVEVPNGDEATEGIVSTSSSSFKTLEEKAYKLRLSEMFGALEKRKDVLRIQEYSISQTSLEQIFNYFASQQEEETGVATGISR